MRRWTNWVAGMTLLVVAACGGEAADSCAQVEARPPASETAPEVDLTAMTQTASGLYFLDMEVGNGEEALSGQTVTVHYSGWFLEGEKFDSSVDRNETFQFLLGAGRVIAGWDEGVAGMLIGGKRRLVIPPELAYGAAGRPGIPANSTLVFDVELFCVGEV